MVENIKSLEELRLELDLVDHDLIQILQNRFSIIDVVGDLKHSQSIPPLDENRWQKVITTRKDWAEEIGLDTDFVEEIFQVIHNHAIKIEKGKQS